MLRLLAYLWAFPVTTVGLCLGLLAVVSGGRLQLRRGVVEVWGGLAGWLLRGNRLWRGDGPGARDSGPGPALPGAKQST